ncbi:hypothetical protein DY000_02040327 [Brassica cretica]|nr:hypothetical protein DY000_02040327 [Brassica cretica]
MSLGGVLVYLFLAAYPDNVGFPDINSNSVRSESLVFRIMFLHAFYLLLLVETGEYMSLKTAGNLSTLFDVGGFYQTVNILFMMVAGLFVNGPYALITTAVSVDFGTHGLGRCVLHVGH